MPERVWAQISKECHVKPCPEDPSAQKVVSACFGYRMLSVSIVLDICLDKGRESKQFES